MPRKKSFFERLTGAINVDDYEEDFEEGQMPAHREHKIMKERSHHAPAQTEPARETQEWLEEEASEGQLAVDVYQTPDDIVIRAHVAGVRPEDLDISITRDMVTIKGRREEAKEVNEDGYYYKELYWGTFSRTILLPQEIETDSVEANEKHGLLTLRLPKIDKERQTKVKVKSS